MPRSGVIDGHYTWPGLWAGLEPGFAAIADLPGGYDTADQQVEMMDKHGGRALLSEIYAKYDVANVGVFYNGVESLPSRKAIKSPAELAGLKIRLPAGIISDVFAKFGAAPVVLPLSEAFPALDKGVVDVDGGRAARQPRLRDPSTNLDGPSPNAAAPSLACPMSSATTRASTAARPCLPHRSDASVLLKR